MTEQQKTALRHHCRLSVETLHPRFRSIVQDVARVILTVDSGYE